MSRAAGLSASELDAELPPAAAPHPERATALEENVYVIAASLRALTVQLARLAGAHGTMPPTVRTVPRGQS